MSLALKTWHTAHKTYVGGGHPTMCGRGYWKLRKTKIATFEVGISSAIELVAIGPSDKAFLQPKLQNCHLS